MNWVDILFLIAVISGAAWGLGYGFIRIGFACGILIAAMGLAGTAAFAIGPSLSWVRDSESERSAAAFLVVFVLLMVVGAMVNFLIKIPLTMVTALVSVVPIVNKLNRGGGLIAGLLFGWILVSVALIGLQQLPVAAVGKGIEQATFASGPIGLVDRFVATIDLSPEVREYD